MHQDLMEAVLISFVSMVTCKYWHVSVILPFAHSVNELLLVLLFQVTWHEKWDVINDKNA